MTRTWHSAQPQWYQGCPGSWSASSSAGSTVASWVVGAAVLLPPLASWQSPHISSRKAPSTSRNGPEVAPQKEHRDPTPRLLLELTFDYRRTSRRAVSWEISHAVDALRKLGE